MAKPKRTTAGWSLLGLFLSALAVVALVTAAAVVLKGQGQPAAPVSPSPQSSPTGVASDTPLPDFDATSHAIMTAVPQVTAARPTGIFDAGSEFFHEGYRMRNAWQGLVDGYWANVVAGATEADPDEGVIFSSWEIAEAAIGRFYNTPTRAGSVQITAEQNHRLTLQATDGTLFYWDIPSQSFVESLTVVVPTITPIPTHTPTLLPPTTSAPTPGGYPVPTAGP